MTDTERPTEDQQPAWPPPAEEMEQLPGFDTVPEKPAERRYPA